MPLKTYLDEPQLHAILAHGATSACVCPAELAREIINIRRLYRYQENCLKDGATEDTHRIIMAAAGTSHELMENALLDILRIEDWDMETMEMPDGLRGSHRS